MQQVDARSFRDVMGRFPTGVTVVTTRNAEGDPVGLTVNSFTSVSLEPPLVLVCIDRGASVHDALTGAAGFAVSVLAADQAEMARRFAQRPSHRRFDDVELDETPGGYPVLPGAVAWLECAVHQTVPAGDHTILLGRVEAMAEGAAAGPLLFERGSFREDVR